MKLNIGDKELNIKFGYKPTLKTRIISKVIKLSDIKNENGEEDMTKVEDLLLFLPEMLLVGLQVHHEEYRYNYDTNEDKEDKLEEAFNLLEKYTEDGGDALELFKKLQTAMEEDSFLANLVSKEREKVEKKVQAKKKTEN